jgi:hypothetical protein
MSERWPCVCGHPHVSHGSQNAMNQWVGLGMGQCGGLGEGGEYPCQCLSYDPKRPFTDGEPVTFRDAERGPVDAAIMFAPLPARPGEPYLVHVAGDAADEVRFAMESDLTTRLVNHFGGTPMYDEECCSSCGGTKALHAGPLFEAGIGLDCTGYTT